MITNTSDYLINYWDLLESAIIDRNRVNIDNICKYGIPMLDNYLGWILPSELVVIWADPWVGKSEIAYLIAIENAMRWKKILLLSLEWDLQEIALRHLQREINKFATIKTADYRFNLTDLTDIEYQAFERISDKVKNNLLIYNKKQIPDLIFVKNLIEATKDNIDMIIIDHLHYIQIEWENENRVIWEIMRELKTITDIIKKPIILMSHLRKRDTKQDPEIYDLYWSSNVSKEATTILLVSRMNHSLENWIPWVNEDDKRYSKTKISVRKSRIWLPLSNFETLFDRYKKEYISWNLIKEQSMATEDDNLHNLIKRWI